MSSKIQRVSSALFVLGVVACSTSNGTATDAGVAADVATSAVDGGGTTTTDSGDAATTTTDSAVAMDSAVVTMDAASDASTVDAGSCNGCVAGPSSAGADSVTLTSVTGLVDGTDDTVATMGSFHLASAATATLFITCLGQSSGSSTRQMVTGPDATFSIGATFNTCDANIVQLGLTIEGMSSSLNYVKCCFFKGRDF